MVIDKALKNPYTCTLRNLFVVTGNVIWPDTIIDCNPSSPSKSRTAMTLISALARLSSTTELTYTRGSWNLYKNCVMSQ